MSTGTDLAGGALAVIFIALIVLSILALVMVSWGLIFMLLDWAVPGIIHAVLPASVAVYSPFQIGAAWGLVFGAVRSVFKK